MEQGLSYKDSAVGEDIIRAVGEMGFTEMTPIQEQAIPVLLEGKDIIGQAQTGTGKTAAFGIPLIQNIDPAIRKLQGIVLCPTRELAMQAAEEIRRLAKYTTGVKVLPVYGGQDISRQIRALSQGVQIVVGTPGRVMDHMRRHTIKTAGIKMIVLDEADEMLNMGFREDIETILKDMPEEHQMALFSATMPKPILDITRGYQQDAVYIKVTPQEITIPLIKQAFYKVQRKDKEEVMCRLMDYYQPKRTLIFANTKRMVDELAEHLKSRGYQAEGLHGDLSQNQRDTVMNLFRSGRTDILIATDVAARGIDVSGVDAVFNFDVPDDIEYYVHRIGRTGRAGKTGRSFTLVTGREIYKIRDIERVCNCKIKERKIPSVEDIVTVKRDKVLQEALEVMNEKDLSRIEDAIKDAMIEKDFTALQLAAALMQARMGDEPEEIKEEKPFYEKKPFKQNRGDRNDRGYHGENRSGKGSYYGRKDGTSYKKEGASYKKDGGKSERYTKDSGLGYGAGKNTIKKLDKNGNPMKVTKYNGDSFRKFTKDTKRKAD